MVSNQIADITEEMGQVELGWLATTSGEVIHAGDAGVQLMLRLADGITSPTQLPFGLPLAQAKGFDRLRQKSPTPGTVKRLGRFLQQGTHCCCQFHVATSQLSRWHYTKLQRTNYFPVFA